MTASDLRTHREVGADDRFRTSSSLPGNSSSPRPGKPAARCPRRIRRGGTMPSTAGSAEAVSRRPSAGRPRKSIHLPGSAKSPARLDAGDTRGRWASGMLDRRQFLNSRDARDLAHRIDHCRPAHRKTRRDLEAEDILSSALGGRAKTSRTRSPDWTESVRPSATLSGTRATGLADALADAMGNLGGERRLKAEREIPAVLVDRAPTRNTHACSQPYRGTVCPRGVKFRGRVLEPLTPSPRACRL